MLNATKKALIWAVAVAIPLQGIPASSCGCTIPSEAACDSTCCHKSQDGGHSCCSTHGAGHSCCSAKHHQGKTCCCRSKGHCDRRHCTCGVNCPCRQGKQTPPATPPAEQRSLEKVLCSGLACNQAVVSLASAKPLRLSIAPAPFDTASGSDRCISLCRFTL